MTLFYETDSASKTNLTLGPLNTSILYAKHDNKTFTNTSEDCVQKVHGAIFIARRLRAKIVLFRIQV